MSLRHLASALLFTALFACQSGEPADAAKAAPAAEKKADEPITPPPAEPVEPTPTPEPASTETDTGEEEPLAPLPATFEQVGVDVCDQYVADYGKCIDTKMAEADREAARRSVFENITVWKQTASGGPAGQKSLQTACRIAREQAKRATANLGCEW